MSAAAAVSSPSEAQTRRALAWARSPDHPSILAILDGCPDLTWCPGARLLRAAPSGSDPGVEAWLDGEILWIEIVRSEGRTGAWLRIPCHILSAEIPL